MKGLQEIATAIERAPTSGGAPVLATLVRLEGSAYSGPGSRLLVRPDASITGALGANCFEQDLAAHAARVRADATPTIVAYDLTADDEKAWGLGMGCHGKLDLLLEPVAAGAVPEPIAFALEAARRRQSAALVTLFATGGDPALSLGTRLMVRADGHAAGPLVHAPLGDAVLAEARAALAAGRSRLVTLPVAGGEAGFLVEVIAPPIALVVCGDGRDTAPLARFAAELGWEVTVLEKEATPQQLDERSAVVVMSHNYARDLALLAAALPSRAKYVGILGSRTRTQRLLDELATRTPAPTRRQLARLHFPVGLDVGAETPAEVALSIVAEVLAAFAGRTGGLLRKRRGAIHDRP
jgi:xanthine dehydrogenase accessory factor